MLGRWGPGQKHAQLLLKVKDEVGAMADIDAIASKLRVDFRQLEAYAVEEGKYAVYNAFVEFKEPKVTPDRLVAELEKSRFVLEAHAAAGVEGGIIDTLTFPATWGGWRVVILGQTGMAGIFQDIQSTFGTGGDVILHKGGLVYGKDLVEFLGRKMGKDFVVQNFEYALGLLSAGGWGVPALAKVDLDTLAATVTVAGCFECEGKKSSKPMCAFERGTFAGVAGAIFGVEFECVETKCSGRGDELCEFQLKPKR